MWVLLLLILAVIIFDKIARLERKLDRLDQEIRNLEKTAAPGSGPENPFAVPSPGVTGPQSAPTGGKSAPVQVAPCSGTGVKTRRYRPNLEKIIGERWLVWVGTLAFAVGLAFFIRYAFEHGWVNAPARVILGFAAGFLFIALGEFLYRKKFEALAQGISALGLILFYLTVFTAHHYYGILGMRAASLVFIAAGFGGMSLAIYHNAFPTACLGVFGAFATPLLLADPGSAAIRYGPELFSYLLIVNLGVLYAAAARRWRALSLCALMFTAVYFGSWRLQAYAPADFPLALTFAVCYFLTFALACTAHGILRKDVSNPEDVVLIALNPAIFFILLYQLAPDQAIPASFALFAANCHFILAALVRKVNPRDRFLYFTLTGTAAGLLTLPPPILVASRWVTTAWGLEALALIAVGALLDRKSLRFSGLAVLGLAAWRLFFLDAFLPPDAGSRLFFNLPFLALLVSVAAFALAGVLFARLKNISPVEKRCPALLWYAFAAGLFLVMNREIFFYFGTLKAPLAGMKWVFTTVCWTLFAWFFLAAGFIRNNFTLRKTGYFLLAAVALKWLLVDTPALYRDVAVPATMFTVYGLPFILNLKFLSLALVLSAAAAIPFFYGRCPEKLDEREKGAAPLAWLFFIALLFIGLNLEIVSCLTGSVGFTARAVWYLGATVLWAAFALALFILGFREKISLFRAAGILLITGACVKTAAESLGLFFLFPNQPLLLLNLKFLSAGAVLFTLALAAAFYGREDPVPAGQPEIKAGPYLWALFLLLLFVELNAQAATAAGRLLWRLDEQRLVAALSFLWVFYGFGLLVVGMVRKVMPLRIAALSLFGFTLLKVLLVDMRFVDPLYKMLLLLGIGAVLLAGAFFYRKYRKKLEETTP